MFCSPIALSLLLGGNPLALLLLECGELGLDQVTLLLEVTGRTLVEGEVAIINALLADAQAS